MSGTYKIGKGRATKTVEARQYTRDQDWDLANWIDGPVQVYRNHFSVGPDEQYATKGDWIIKYPDGHIEVRNNKLFTATARQAEE